MPIWLRFLLVLWLAVGSAFAFSRDNMVADQYDKVQRELNFAVVDEVLVSLFRAPHSYTGQDSVEVSCHGSAYIQQRILQVLVDAGARLAAPGEFTMRAFLNGKLDLSQAEAVADLIGSSSEAERRMAMQQMRGGFSAKIKGLRDQLLSFISLIELELDFSEEDVQFADRRQLSALIAEISRVDWKTLPQKTAATWWL